MTRAVEPELIPALRKLNMRFLAYNPSAGGLLDGEAYRGKLSDDGTKPGARGRFTENKMYRDRFWNERYFAAVDTVCAACETHGVAPAGLRAGCTVTAVWTARKDCVILGPELGGPHLEANRPPRKRRRTARRFRSRCWKRSRRRSRCARRWRDAVLARTGTAKIGVGR